MKKLGIIILIGVNLESLIFLGGKARNAQLKAEEAERRAEHADHLAARALSLDYEVIYASKGRHFFPVLGKNGNWEIEERTEDAK